MFSQGKVGLWIFRKAGLGLQNFRMPLRIALFFLQKKIEKFFHLLLNPPAIDHKKLN